MLSRFISTGKVWEVLTDAEGTHAKGFFAAGECSCVSVHGANRLGTNSLLEAVVFGERAGKSAFEYAKMVDHAPVNESHEKTKVLEQFEGIFQQNGDESYNDIRNQMKIVMTENCSVFREEKQLKTCIETIEKLQEKFKNGKITDKGKLFNTEIYEILELENMLAMAEIIAKGALDRKESRGGHYRIDYPKRDDKNFLKHSLAYKTDDGIEIKHKPVVITKHQPAERTY